MQDRHPALIIRDILLRYVPAQFVASEEEFLQAGKAWDEMEAPHALP